MSHVALICFSCVQVKQNEAAAFVNTIKGPQWGGEGNTVAVNVDPGMLAALQRASIISPAWLAACASTMGTSLNSMAVLAANNNTMQVRSLFHLLPKLLSPVPAVDASKCAMPPTLLVFYFLSLSATMKYSQLNSSRPIVDAWMYCCPQCCIMVRDSAAFCVCAVKLSHDVSLITTKSLTSIASPV